MRAHTSLPLPSPISQIDGLQALRAIAVMLVAWLHTRDYLHVKGAPRLPSLGPFGIDLFFVLSGFILSSVVMRERAGPGLRTMGRFLSRRLIRIYPVYWVFALIAIVRLWHAGQLFKQNYIPAFFLMPPWVYPDFPLLHAFSWTLIFEMTFYVLLALVLLRTVKLAPYTLIGLLCMAVGVGAVMDIHRPFWIIVCNPILLEFVLGAVIALLYRSVGRRPRLGMILTMLGIAATFFWARVDSPRIADGVTMIAKDAGVFARVATFGLAAFLIVGGVVFWSPGMEGRLGRTLVVLGNASYSTYLISSIAVEIALRILLAVHTPHTSVLEVVYVLFCILVILGAGWMFYDFVEWPLLRFLQRKMLH